MKQTLTIIFTLFVAASLQAEIRFLHGPFADAIKKAEAEQKPVMIDFITDWCRWCDTLDARNSNVIPIKIDAEKGEGIDLAIALEQQALDILKNVPGAKMKEYEQSMAKFKAGKRSGGTQ